MTSLPVSSRGQAELLRLAYENMADGKHTKISPTPTHVEFVAHIGTHREAVTKELNKMRKMGFVEHMGRTLVVHDATAIEPLSRGGRAQ